MLIEVESATITSLDRTPDHVFRTTMSAKQTRPLRHTHALELQQAGERGEGRCGGWSIKAQLVTRKHRRLPDQMFRVYPSSTLVSSFLVFLQYGI